jgi:phosphodiesterase/alkaline phosphatase D-like protein
MTTPHRTSLHRSLLVSRSLLGVAVVAVVALAGLVACGSDVQDVGQGRLDTAGGDDGADLADTGDLVDDDGVEPDAPDFASDDAEDSGPAPCPSNMHREDGECVCDGGFLPHPDAPGCVRCVDDGDCGDRVCAGFTCRSCLSNAECGDGRFCGDDGLCADDPTACSDEGELRCVNHGTQTCSGGFWTDSPGVCPFGCDEESGACYPDTNVGWIGGRCEAADDCTGQTPEIATCLGADEGFAGGHCTQSCTLVCPDSDAADATPTFCVESEGLTGEGICVSQCDFGFFADTGCRAGYECRAMPRRLQPGVVRDVCLPINWWRNPSRGFDYGVTAGDVTQTEATIWAQTGSADAEVVVEYGLAGSALLERAEGEATRDTGYTTHVRLTGLDPDTAYEYRVVLDGGLATSEVGRFRTALPAGAGEPFTFIFSGDVDDRPAFYGLFDVMRQAGGDFYFAMGDWPYADAATTLDTYRAEHRATRGERVITEFLRSTSLWAIFDDHEVINDWDGAFRAANPERVEIGLRVWREWFPFHAQFEGRHYRSFVWGDVEFFILDTRSHRSPSAQFDNLDKTMLGEEQLAWLLDGLEASEAVFKVIVSSVPLDFTTNGNDAWVGFKAERNLIWDSIICPPDGDGGCRPTIDGVVFITADQHWFAAYHHNSGFKEFQAGPISAFLRRPGDPSPNKVAVVEAYNFIRAQYDPADGGSLTFEGFDGDPCSGDDCAIPGRGNLLYRERVRAGAGRIEVRANPDVEAKFIICAEESTTDACSPGVEQPCAHTFVGMTPWNFEYAVPGPYRIEWYGLAGFETPVAQEGCLEDGETLVFTGEFPVAALPFSDDFAVDRGWHVVDEGFTEGPSNWDWSEGELVQRSNIYDVNADDAALPKLGTLVWNGNPGWTDYTVEVSFNTPDDDGVGVIARYIDQDNYYRLSVDRQRSFVRLVARVDGVFSLLDADEAFAGYASDTWTELRLTVDGSAIRGYVDGALVVSATDARLPAGAVGLYSWGSQGVRFDDLSVTAE